MSSRAKWIGAVLLLLLLAGLGGRLALLRKAQVTAAAATAAIKVSRRRVAAAVCSRAKGVYLATPQKASITAGTFSVGSRKRR